VPSDLQTPIPKNLCTIHSYILNTGCSTSHALSIKGGYQKYSNLLVKYMIFILRNTLTITCVNIVEDLYIWYIKEVNSSYHNLMTSQNHVSLSF